MGGTGRGAATGGATHQPQATADTPAGPAGKAAALNPARSYRNLGSTGRASVAAAPVISARSASASAADHSMLWDGGEGHAGPTGWAQVLWPLVVRASAALSSAAQMTAQSTSLVCCQP